MSTNTITAISSGILAKIAQFWSNKVRKKTKSSKRPKENYKNKYKNNKKQNWISKKKL